MSGRRTTTKTARKTSWKQTKTEKTETSQHRQIKPAEQHPRASSGPRKPPKRAASSTYRACRPS